MEDVMEMPLLFHECWEVVGLEKMLSRGFYRDKKFRREHLLNAVDEIQSSLGRCSYNRDLDHDPVWHSIRATLLRRVSENISAPSKLFARYLGEVSRSQPQTI